MKFIITWTKSNFLGLLSSYNAKSMLAQSLLVSTHPPPLKGSAPAVPGSWLSSGLYMVAIASWAQGLSASIFSFTWCGLVSKDMHPQNRRYVSVSSWERVGMGEFVKTANGTCYFCKGSQEIEFPYLSTRKIMGSDAGKDEDISEVPVKRQEPSSASWSLSRIRQPSEKRASFHWVPGGCHYGPLGWKWLLETHSLPLAHSCNFFGLLRH